MDIVSNYNEIRFEMKGTTRREITLVFEKRMGYKCFYGKDNDERKTVLDRRAGPGIVFFLQCRFLPRPKISEDSDPGL